MDQENFSFSSVAQRRQKVGHTWKRSPPRCPAMEPPLSPPASASPPLPSLSAPPLSPRFGPAPCSPGASSARRTVGVASLDPRIATARWLGALVHQNAGCPGSTAVALLPSPRGRRRAWGRGALRARAGSPPPPDPGTGGFACWGLGPPQTAGAQGHHVSVPACPKLQ